MKCADCQELLSALLDHELGGREALMVSEHVAGCSECAKELEELRLTVRLLGQVEPIRRTPAPVLRPIEKRRPLAVWGSLMAAAAAGALMAWVFWPKDSAAPAPPMAAQPNVQAAPSDPAAGYAAIAVSASRR
jgi:anti-sigma factor RsiW